MAEVSFKREIESLKLKDGDTFHGEGIIAVTKALLQSGVSYVGGIRARPWAIFSMCLSRRRTR